MNLFIPERVSLAPLAGVSNFAYRTVCAENGCRYAVTEMVSAKALSYNDSKSFALADVTHDIIPVAIQLFGREPDVFRAAVNAVMKFSPTAIDINMGCPVPKVAGNGEGSALMREPRLAGEIVRAVVAESPVPVTVKIRSGWTLDTINAPEIAKICEQNGAAAIAVHARTRAQGYSGKADHTVTAAVKQSVRIPVIANGDIDTPEKAREITDMTGCDGVMIGRAAYGAPWIFNRFEAFERSIPYTEPSAEEKKRIIKRHIALLCDLRGEYSAVAESRGHLTQYITGIPGAASARRSVNTLKSVQEIYELIDTLELT